MTSPSTRYFRTLQITPKNLPKWTKAFAKPTREKRLGGHAKWPHLQVDLKVIVSKMQRHHRQWLMTMPDDTSAAAAAYSRATPNGSGTVYSFVLMSLPVPIEQVEGTLHQQKELLSEELGNLQKILK